MNLLVRKAKKGDKAAFTQLMEEQGPSLYKIAKAILKDNDDVADIENAIRIKEFHFVLMVFL